MLSKVVFLLLFGYSLQASTPSSLTYDAAVVEFNYERRPNTTSKEITDENLSQYIKIMQEINPKPDIIVFPESTLNLFLTAVEIPEPEEKISPCEDESYPADNLLKKLSCSAVEHGFYLVVNIATKAKCPDPEMVENNDPRDCSKRADGFSYYNTNVVFDRSGTVISRYRKFNLFGESVDKPFKPQLATFETDFGVKFGHFICFDLMFRSPAVELVRSLNVTDIIFPTMWFSELPFLTAVQVQQNWAHSFDVNFLAAGANLPRVGSTGTGIYGGKKGPYVTEMSGINNHKVLKATIYKKIPENENVILKYEATKYDKNVMKNLYLKRDQLDAYDMTFLEDKDGLNFAEKNVCRDGMCCNIKVNYTLENSSNKDHYKYVLAFYHGKRTFDGYADGGVVACTIFACSNSSVSSCGVRNETLENIHIWNKIEISGNFPTKDGQFLYMPTSVDTSILPLQPKQFVYDVKHKEDEDEISITLNKHADDLLSFGIYGRDFNLDNGSSSITFSVGLFLIAFLVALC